MSKYTYNCVDLGILKAKAGLLDSSAEKKLQETIDNYVKNGWELFQIHAMPVYDSPGCLYKLFGFKNIHYSSNMLVFRKEA